MGGKALISTSMQKEGSRSLRTILVTAQASY